MNIQRRLRTTCGLAVSLAMISSLGVVAVAQDSAPPPAQQTATDGQHAMVQGLVIGRDASTMYVKTSDTPRVTVILSDSTKATQKGGGFLGWGRKDLAITQLVPGLQVKVEGSYNSDHQLLANKVTFSRNSMRTAQQIEAGTNPVEEKVAAAQDQLKSDRRDIQQSQADINTTQQGLATTQQGLASTTQIANTNTQGIGKANQRFTTLDQYDTKGSVTVNFRNGSALVSKKDRDQLTDFLQSSANTPGMMVQVQGYASKVGSAELNQRLSSERAEAVIAIIQQSGSIPLTSILAPAAMGVTDQVGNNHTRSGQAQNRRVVVTILVNKGITGASATTPGSGI
ncbi:MAG: OmpA family protein [Acidobacteriaceae bacterium]